MERPSVGPPALQIHRWLALFEAVVSRLARASDAALRMPCQQIVVNLQNRQSFCRLSLAPIRCSSQRKVGSAMAVRCRVMTVKLRQIEVVIAASEHGSMRKAALALHVQESAISRHVHDLENSLGTPLFTRSASGVRLTAAGRDFIEQARKILAQLGVVKDVIRRRSDAEMGELRIGIFSSLASGFLTKLISAFRTQHAGVRLTFIECNPSEHIAAVRKHNTDIAFITGTTIWAGCQSERLWTERVFSVLPANHLLASRSSIGINELAGDRFIVSESPPGEEIHDYLIKRLADLGFHPDIKRQSVGRDNLLHLVALGVGVTLTSEATVAAALPDIAYVPIVDEALPFSAVWSESNGNPALGRLLELARSISIPAMQSNESGEL